MAIANMAQKDAVRVHGIGGEQHVAGGDAGEMLGALQDGWSSVSAFGRAIPNQKASDVVFNESLVEIVEEL